MKKRINTRNNYLAAGFILIAAMTFTGASAINYTPHADEGGLFSAATVPQVQSSGIGIPVKKFYAVLADKDNNKWFLTESGIVSFSAGKWTLHKENEKIAASKINDFAYRNYPGGPEFWIASTEGATVTTLPIEATSKATTYLAGEGSILSNDVVKVTLADGPLRWFGTDKGISAFMNDKWLVPSYEDTYPMGMFKEYPITSMATNPAGDSLYVGTDGAGVARVFRNDVDGISGASVYAQWGPIILPSDKIFSIYIAPGGTKWFGTDLGVASHSGGNTLENWSVYTTDDGLVNNFVQAIGSDAAGNMWFGTKGGGISVFDGSKWTTYTVNNGLNSNNILCLTVDSDGVVWIGTDDGVNSFREGVFSSYR